MVELLPKTLNRLRYKFICRTTNLKLNFYVVQTLLYCEMTIWLLYNSFPYYKLFHTNSNARKNLTY